MRELIDTNLFWCFYVFGVIVDKILILVLYIYIYMLYIYIFIYYPPVN